MDDIEGLVPLSDGEDLPVAPERPEKSMDWVIETYRKHCLNKVTAWLNENLGKGRGKKTLIPRVLLDINPIDHRQSLLEVVFPAPRRINEKLFDVNRLKFMLDADSGMGKTTFLMHYLEELLDAASHPIYSLPVYFHLGNVPEGGGFQQFRETVNKEIIDNKTTYFVKSTKEKKIIPNFLIDKNTDELDNVNLLNGLKLVGDYLEKNILKPNNLNYPVPRQDFVKVLK